MIRNMLQCVQCKIAYSFQLKAVLSTIVKYSNVQSVNCSNITVQSSEEKCSSPSEKLSSTFIIPEAPTTCCMSGCANCVWLEYAEKLKTIFKDGEERAIKEIMDKVTDTNVRSFLLMELRTMNMKK